MLFMIFAVIVFSWMVLEVILGTVKGVKAQKGLAVAIRDSITLFDIVVLIISCSFLSCLILLTWYNGVTSRSMYNDFLFLYSSALEDKEELATDSDITEQRAMQLKYQIDYVNEKIETSKRYADDKWLDLYLPTCIADFPPIEYVLPTSYSEVDRGLGV